VCVSIKLEKKTVSRQQSHMINLFSRCTNAARTACRKLVVSYTNYCPV